jgi:hypothetical protein
LEEKPEQSSLFKDFGIEEEDQDEALARWSGQAARRRK